MALHGFEKKALGFLATQLVAGLVAAAVFTAGLLYLDSFGLWTLIRTSDDGILAAAMLFAGSAITFGSVAMGAGVMLLERRGED
jgi:O-antigen ligase